MDVYLLDGTYELFRHFFAVPKRQDAGGREIGALVATTGSVLRMLEDGCTHLGVATDHVIRSFRNDLWADYKTEAGVAPDLLQQFTPFEDALSALGVTVWAMVECEADDALGSAAAIAARDPRVGRVFICTPDKDLGQAVVGERVVQYDRRLRVVRDAAGVQAKFGVPPSALADYLALVGDQADGFPGVRGWGAKSAAIVLARYGSIEAIPRDHRQWDIAVPRAAALAEALDAQRDLVALFQTLARLRTDLPLFEDVGALAWHGPRPEFQAVAASLGAPELWQRACALAERVVV